MCTASIWVTQHLGLIKKTTMPKRGTNGPPRTDEWVYIWLIRCLYAFHVGCGPNSAFMHGRHVMVCVRTPNPSALPPSDLFLFTAVADVSILTLNLSLMVNTVSFYQVRG